MHHQGNPQRRETLSGGTVLATLWSNLCRLRCISMLPLDGGIGARLPNTSYCDQPADRRHSAARAKVARPLLRGVGSHSPPSGTGNLAPPFRWQHLSLPLSLPLKADRLRRSVGAVGSYGYSTPRSYGYYGYAPRTYGGAYYGRRLGWRGYGYGGLRGYGSRGIGVGRVGVGRVGVGRTGRGR